MYTTEGGRWIRSGAMKGDLKPGPPGDKNAHEKANPYGRGCLKIEKCRGIPDEGIEEIAMSPPSSTPPQQQQLNY